ncbi:hypothetical protein, partial [Phaeovulum sp.]|uniref:hypothetical protein n=1 Tax=Phaeovulum sp. TaxID=2934796 RepID=UPI0035690283
IAARHNLLRGNCCGSETGIRLSYPTEMVELLATWPRRAYNKGAGYLPALKSGGPMSQSATRRVAFLLLLAVTLYVAFTGGW